MKVEMKGCEKMKGNDGIIIFTDFQKLTKYKGTKAKGFKGDLDLSYSKITSLPNNLSVGGWLSLSNTQITSLPDNLSVGGSLDLSYSKITSLPDNLSVGGNLYLRGTKIIVNESKATIHGAIIK